MSTEMSLSPAALAYAERQVGPLLAELRKAKEAITHVDALVSTAARSIASGDAADADLTVVLENYAWPKIETARTAIDAALEFAGDDQDTATTEIASPATLAEGNGGIRNDESNADDIRIFLAGFKPMNSGDNVAYWAGRSVVERLAVAEDTDNDSLRPTLAQCVDVLSFLTSIEPQSSQTCPCAGNRESIGLHLVLDEISMRIAEHIERREKTA